MFVGSTVDWQFAVLLFVNTYLVASIHGVLEQRTTLFRSFADLRI